MQGENGRALEAEVGLEVLGNLTDEALRGGREKGEGNRVRDKLTKHMARHPPLPPVLPFLSFAYLEGQLADEELGALLVLADLTEGDRPGAVTVGLLHPAGRGRGLAGGLGREGGRRGREGGRGRWVVSNVLRCGMCLDGEI